MCESVVMYLYVCNAQLFLGDTKLLRYYAITLYVYEIIDLYDVVPRYHACCYIGACACMYVHVHVCTCMCVLVYVCMCVRTCVQRENPQEEARSLKSLRQRK